MSDEPLYCTHCGKEQCGCPPEDGMGPYCDICGVIHPAQCPFEVRRSPQDVSTATELPDPPSDPGSVS
jgi:hypothetical protein